jgi:hypothetical protein
LLESKIDGKGGESGELWMKFIQEVKFVFGDPNGIGLSLKSAEIGEDE